MLSWIWTILRVHGGTIFCDDACNIKPSDDTCNVKPGSDAIAERYDEDKFSNIYNRFC